MSVLFVLYNVFLLFFISLVASNMGIFLIGILGLTVFMISSHGIGYREYKKYVFYVSVAFIFMFLLYHALIQKYGIPYYGGDDQNFEEYGKLLYNQDILYFKDIPYIQGMWYAKGYVLVIAWIERISNLVGEYSTWSPRILNIYLWMSISAIVYKKIKIKVDMKTSEKALTVLALFPNALYISSFVYRDTLVCFLIVVGVTAFEKCIDTIAAKKINFIPSAILVCVSLYFLYYIRLQICFVMLVIFAIKFFIGRIDLSQITDAKKLLILSISALVSIFLLQALGGLDLLSSSSESYTNYRFSGNEGLSRIVFSFPIFPFGIIVRFLYGLISPFPGGLLKLNYISEPLYSGIQAIVFVGTIFQFFLLPYLFSGLKKVNYSALKFAIMFLSIVITTFTFRHFIMVYPFMAEVIAENYAETDQVKRNINIRNMSLIVVAAALFYVIAKLV